MVRATLFSYLRAGRGLLRRKNRTFVRDRSGTTAIEFSLVAMPFLAMLFAILETALSLWSSQVLDNAVTNAGRLIYTGQFQQANAATTDPSQLAAKFKEELCRNIVALLDCSEIKIDVRAADSFPDQSPQPPITADKQFDAANFGKYEPPGPNKVVVIRAAYEYPVFVSLMNPNQANLANGKRLLMGSAAFRTEPY